MIVLVPISKGTPGAIQSSAPFAIPDAPAAVCQVTCVTPAPPPALPLSEMPDADVEYVDVEGDLIEIASGAAPAAGVVCNRVTVTDCTAAWCAASSAETVMVFVPVTSVTPEASQLPDAASVAFPL